MSERGRRETIKVLGAASLFAGLQLAIWFKKRRSLLASSEAPSLLQTPHVFKTKKEQQDIEDRIQLCLKRETVVKELADCDEAKRWQFVGTILPGSSSETLFRQVRRVDTTTTSTMKMTKLCTTFRNEIVALQALADATPKIVPKFETAFVCVKLRQPFALITEKIPRDSFLDYIQEAYRDRDDFRSHYFGIEKGVPGMFKQFLEIRAVARRAKFVLRDWHPGNLRQSSDGRWIRVGLGLAERLDASNPKTYSESLFEDLSPFVVLCVMCQLLHKGRFLAEAYRELLPWLNHNESTSQIDSDKASLAFFNTSVSLELVKLWNKHGWRDVPAVAVMDAKMDDLDRALLATFDDQKAKQ